MIATYGKKRKKKKKGSSPQKIAQFTLVYKLLASTIWILEKLTYSDRYGTFVSIYDKCIPFGTLFMYCIEKHIKCPWHNSIQIFLTSLNMKNMTCNIDDESNSSQK